jgi:hypothetical protein
VAIDYRTEDFLARVRELTGNPPTRPESGTAAEAPDLLTAIRSA